ncbi:helix-turn-helix domain-containing protein [Vagococcus fessus]|uniref:Mga helix-turn-helix domain-containing protein n=1 Tax=Vagococcus fessus TaxID=120370 RepID=A0A430ADD0_9ENTE|nr:helix-turn-helix domain containing protein [Vagococcus fessus]RSU05226.1 hypothetical protein CBF31_04210 [Vagococcus fessus]
MRNLLDTSTKRRLEIIEQLNLNSKWISSNDLAKKNNASLRTINSDIQYLKENAEDFFTIETSKKNGVRLKARPNSDISLIYNRVIKSSDAFNLLEKIFFNPNVLIENWDEEMFISESSLYRTAGQLSNSLKSFDITLQKRPCHLTNHNEENVRSFYTNYFSEVYGIHNWPFSLDRRLIVRLAEEFYTIFEHASDEFLIIQLTYLLAVSLERYKQGFLIELSDNQKISRSRYQKYINNSANLSDTLNEMGIEITDDLVNDLVNSVYFLKATWVTKIDENRLKKQFDELLNKIQYDLGIQLDEQSRADIHTILLLIQYKHTFFPYTDYILYDRYEFNSNAIKINYPAYNTTVTHHLKELEKVTGFPWHSKFNNKVLYWMMVKWNKLPTLLENKKKRVNIMIFSDLGLQHAELLTDMIEKNFNSKVNLTIYRGSTIFLEEVDPDEMNQYDFHITTFYHELFPPHKTIVVEAIPSDQDWGKIRNAIHSIYRFDPQTYNL